jgi:hypothetical protein
LTPSVALPSRIQKSDNVKSLRVRRHSHRRPNDCTNQVRDTSF